MIVSWYSYRDNRKPKTVIAGIEKLFMSLPHIINQHRFRTLRVSKRRDRVPTQPGLYRFVESHTIDPHRMNPSIVDGKESAVPAWPAVPALQVLRSTYGSSNDTAATQRSASRIQPANKPRGAEHRTLLLLRVALA